MNTVIVNLFSDGEHRGTMYAEHDQTNRSFQTDWEKAKRIVQRRFPKEWQVLDIENELRQMGWRLSTQEAVEVQY